METTGVSLLVVGGGGGIDFFDRSSRETMLCVPFGSFDGSSTLPF